MTGLCSRWAALLGLAAAFQAAAQEAPAEAFLLRELFRPVAAQPGLGGLPIHARVSVADDVVDCDILAIETILETGEDGIALSPEQRLEHWHALSERHARQLRELDRAEYLDIKRREFAQSAELQKSLDAQAGD